VVLPGGDSAADLANTTLLKLVDPLDTSVTWSSTERPPTTAGVLAYLGEVLRHDFLDFVQSKRATTSVYPHDERADDQDLSESTIDQRVASYENPEDEHFQSERLVWLVEQFRDDPELLEILRLQLEPAGYNAFSSQELAKRLNTTVVEIENRRRRVIRRLWKLGSATLRISREPSRLIPLASRNQTIRYPTNVQVIYARPL
jgi:hypothetical protein